MTVVKSALRYSAEHEWLNDEDPVRIGITDYAADQLGDVVFAELPEVGDTVTAGEVCGELESTKSVSELYSPVTGTVAEINEDVIQTQEAINTDPTGAGRFFTVTAPDDGDILPPKK